MVGAYRGEERTVFYRSRFEVRPKEGDSTEVWPRIVRTLQLWLEEKEGHLQDRKLPNLHEALTTTFDKYLVHCNGNEKACYLQSSFARGRFDEETPQTHLITKSFAGVGDDRIPQYWAMEYMERSQDESNSWYRRWCTNIGISLLPEGGYVVNVGVYILDDPSCLIDVPAIPQRNVPRFIASMLDLEGCVATSNGVELAKEPIEVGAGDFDRFIDYLTDPGRSIPLLVISSERGERNFLLDPDDCAHRLRGAAAVYTIDLNDRYLILQHRQTFKKGEASFEYAVPFGFARVFLPGVNLASRDGYRRHRFYSAEQLRSVEAQRLVNDVCGAITRLPNRRPGEVVDLRGIREQRDLKARAELDAQLEQLRLEVSKREERPDFGTSSVSAGSIEEMSAKIDSLTEKLEGARDNEQFLLQYIEHIESIEREKSEASDARSADDYEAENSYLLSENDKLECENRKLEEENSDQRLYIKRLREECTSLRQDMGLARAQREVLEGLDRFPSSCIEALFMARDAFPSRLVFLDEAVKSAEEFDSGNENEVWDILRCMACDLWSLLFEESGGGDITRLFRDKTGYELTLSESSTTKNDANLVKIRRRQYGGKTIDISAHVKGKSGGRDRLLRVHYCPDYENKLIVIGHCGEHLETAGTRYVRK